MSWAIPLLSKVRTGPDCWEWLGAKDQDGYGAHYVRGLGQRRAHRLVYELLVAPIPAGLQLDHLCRNRGCVNPAHLEPVTTRVNLLRGDTHAARNAAKTACIHGHPFDEDNTHVRRRGHRECRTCIRERARAYRARQKDAAA